MPCTPEALQVLRKASVLVAPAMAAGAGGVRCLLYFSYVYCAHIPNLTKTTFMMVQLLTFISK